MISWDTIVIVAVVCVFFVGGVVVLLWQRKQTEPGRAGLDGRTGRDGRDGRAGLSLSQATADLIIELSYEVEQLKQKVNALELTARDSQNRIAVLQSELALANSEVAALESLIREQAGRIVDLRSENEALRKTMTRVIKRTGALPDDTDIST